VRGFRLHSASAKVSVVEQAGVENQQPLVPDFGVTLAGPALPVKRLAGVAVTPQGINVDHRKSTVGLLRNRYEDRAPMVVNELIVAKEVFPDPYPPPPFIPTEREHPRFRVMAIRIGRPRPDRVRVEEGDEGLGVLVIPGVGLPIHHRLNLLFGTRHATSFQVPLCGHPHHVPGRSASGRSKYARVFIVARSPSHHDHAEGSRRGQWMSVA
jgi:hypothetical protein